MKIKYLAFRIPVPSPTKEESLSWITEIVPVVWDSEISDWILPASSYTCLEEAKAEYLTLKVMPH